MGRFDLSTWRERRSVLSARYCIESVDVVQPVATDLIIRYTAAMRTITATEASRRFSDLLDAIERGETITITRGHHPVAEIGPARRRTGADLRTALADIAPPDERFAHDIADALAMVIPEERDPWEDA
jgi:prevent-host-death family protein